MPEFSDTIQRVDDEAKGVFWSLALEWLKERQVRVLKDLVKEQDVDRIRQLQARSKVYSEMTRLPQMVVEELKQQKEAEE